MKDESGRRSTRQKNQRKQISGLHGEKTPMKKLFEHNKQNFDKDQLKKDLWNSLSAVADIRVLEDLNTTFSNAINVFNDKKNRFDAKTSNLTAVVGVIFTFIIAITFYILNGKKILLRVEFVAFIAGLIVLLWVLGYLIIIHKPQKGYTEIKESSLLQFGANNNYGDFLKTKILTLSYSSAVNSFVLESSKNKFKKIYWVLFGALIVTIVFGSLIIVNFPDKETACLKGSAKIICKHIESQNIKKNSSEIKNAIEKR